MRIPYAFKPLVAGFILLDIVISANAQVYSPPKVIPPSPAAQNFIRYGEIPVDFSTGVPNISIPIYTAKSRKLELPINISYHASGIKVNDKASVIGLGWVLNAGGLVSRSELSRGDGDFKPGYANADSFAAMREPLKDDLEDFRSFGYWLQGQIANRDYQSDRYFYKLPNGQSGIFRYSFDSAKLIKLPYTPLKIDSINQYYAPWSKNVCIGFRITDETGTIYTYSLPADWPSISYRMDWDLTSIISADKSDTIRLVYKTFRNHYITSTSSGVIQEGDVAIYQEQWPPIIFDCQFNYNLSWTNLNYVESLLDSVVTSGTIVKFTTASDRQDTAIGHARYRVANIAVIDRYTGQTIRTFTLGQSYFGNAVNGNRRLRLDSLSVSGSTSTVIEKYRFKYNTSVELPPYPETLVSGLAFAADFWGYYNGSPAYSPVPSVFVDDSVAGAVSGLVAYKSEVALGVGDRLPNYTYAGAAMLQEIQYPTGGKTVFEFEPNEGRVILPNSTIINQGAGFRIHRIYNYTDSAQLAWYKTYRYPQVQQKTISSSMYKYGQRIVGPNGSAAWIIAYRTYVHSEPLEALNIDNGPPVFYQTVIEYNGDTVNNTGKTVYFYEYPPEETHAYAIPPYDEGRYMPPFEEDRGNYSPKLLTKTDFRKEGFQYLPVSKRENLYAEYSIRKIYTGMHVTPETNYETDAAIYGDYVYCAEALPGNIVCLTAADTKQYPYYMHHIDMHARQSVTHLVETKDYLYGADTTQKVVTTTIYKYDTLTHLQLLEQIVINSKGDSLKTKFKYPKDYAGTAVYDSMVARNIITPVIEQGNYKNSAFLQSSKTNFYNWSNNIIAPQTVESKTLSNDSEIRLRYHAYDAKGNILSVSKEAGEKVSYLWDYKDSYPIAMVRSADTGSIAYTSFEGNSKGKWSFSGIPGPGRKAPTGNLIYNLNGSNNITRSGLSSGTTYIVSYWTTNTNAYSITGTISGYPVAGPTYNGWKFFEHRITGQTQVAISGTGTIDELRLYPLTAQMTTYAYEPSIGTKAVCDASNKITYYDYDAFGRLVMIRDQNRYVLKSISYKYAEHAENSGSNFFLSQQVTQYFARNNCGAGYTGSTMAYTVPEGAYYSTISQAAADQLAQSDINAYGQQYANTNGTCTLMAQIAYSNTIPGSCYMVEFHNTSTFELYYFEVWVGSGTLGSIPPGNYDVTIYDLGCDFGNYRTFNVCSSYTANSNAFANFQGVSINTTTCNSIGIQDL